MSHPLKSIGVGSIVLAAGLILMLGVEPAWQLLLISVVCTAGIGLVFWVGIAFLLGALTLSIVNRLLGNSPPTGIPRPDGKTEALMSYMSRSMQAGANLGQLSRRLSRQGWTQEDIDQAYQRLQQDSP